MLEESHDIPVIGGIISGSQLYQIEPWIIAIVLDWRCLNICNFVWFIINKKEWIQNKVSEESLHIPRDTNT